MLQTSLLLMKSLNKTETPIFKSVVCSLFPKAICLTFIILVHAISKSPSSSTIRAYQSAFGMLLPLSSNNILYLWISYSLFKIFRGIDIYIQEATLSRLVCCHCKPDLL